MQNQSRKIPTHASVCVAALGALLASSALAQPVADKTQTTGGSESIASLPDLNTTSAGEPLHYLSTPEPVVSSDVLTVPPGGVSRWMIHPVPAYLYVLQGDLTLEFVDGKAADVPYGTSVPAVTNEMAPGTKRRSNTASLSCSISGFEGDTGNPSPARWCLGCRTTGFFALISSHALAYTSLVCASGSCKNWKP